MVGHVVFTVCVVYWWSSCRQCCQHAGEEEGYYGYLAGKGVGDQARLSEVGLSVVMGAWEHIYKKWYFI